MSLAFSIIAQISSQDTNVLSFPVPAWILLFTIVVFAILCSIFSRKLSRLNKLILVHTAELDHDLRNEIRVKARQLERYSEKLKDSSMMSVESESIMLKHLKEFSSKEVNALRDGLVELNDKFRSIERRHDELKASIGRPKNPK